MKIGELELSIGNSAVNVEGESLSGERQVGSSIGAEARIRDGALLEIGYTTWANGERDVRVFSRLSGPEMYDRLIKGVRLGVQSRSPGTLMSEMRILTAHKERQPTMVKAQQSDFDFVLGEPVDKFLQSHGVIGFGTREQVIGDNSNRRNYLAATFAMDNEPAPFVIYVVTRVLPLLRGFGSARVVPVGQA